MLRIPVKTPYQTRKPQTSMGGSMGEFFIMLDELKSFKTKLEQAIGGVRAMSNELTDKLAEVDTTLKQVLAIQKGDKGDGPDYKYIIDTILSKIGNIKDSEINAIKERIMSEIPMSDELKVHKKTFEETIKKTQNISRLLLGKVSDTEKILSDAQEAIRNVPKPIHEMKVVRIKGTETDPMAIIDKILGLPDQHIDKLKKRLKLDGMEQTISAFNTQLSRGYLHGGGIPSLSAGSGITLTKKSDGGYTVISTGGGTRVYGEVPTDSGDQTNFTLAHTPTTGTLRVYRGGAYQQNGVDYTLSGLTITLSSALESGNTIICDYEY